MKKNKKAIITTLLAFVGAIALGVLLHYTYELCEKNYFVALFSAVNESIWEHLKLLYMPFLFTAVFEYFVCGRHTANFFSSKLVGIISGILYVVSMYYTVVGAFGINSMAVNIGIFIIGTAIAYIVAYKLIKKKSFGGGLWETLAIVCFALITVSFFVFTFNQPTLPIFRDPTDMSYGAI